MKTTIYNFSVFLFSFLRNIKLFPILDLIYMYMYLHVSEISFYDTGTCTQTNEKYYEQNS